ncbi:MAG: acyl-CoA desaturase [Chitinophagaceae bacterium]|nr:MAG: acyl-CoA desaturase [Chitinophagaceae bacterium]
MAFIDNILDTPSYGWKDENGELVKPTPKQLWAEAFRRINVFRDKRNWITMTSWLMATLMVPFVIAFFFFHFSWPMLALAVLYTFVMISSHGTIWFHRYCTHKAYKFSHPIFRIITQNLAIKTFPEEIYVLSHHVHHVKSDMPGDPYNPKGGWLYCMLSDVNHQSINKNLSESDYKRAAFFMQHTGVWINSYEQYKKWGSVASPVYTIGLWLLNWGFWYGALYLIGGHSLACAIFSAAVIWFVGVRAFNYTGHGKGEEKHVHGLDFDRSNLSLNQSRPGLFAGEWHNNHHLYPGSARAGFLPGQLDIPWIYIYCLHKIGAVTSFHDSKKDFIRRYVEAQKVKEPVRETIVEPQRLQQVG